MTTTINALRKAQKDGVISITPRTTNIIKALAQLNQAAEDYNTAIEDNAPDIYQDARQLDSFSDAFYTLYEPLQKQAYQTAGLMIFTELFSTLKFKGL